MMLTDRKKFKMVRQEYEQSDELFETQVIEPLLLDGWEVVGVSTEAWEEDPNTAIVFLRK